MNPAKTVYPFGFAHVNRKCQSCQAVDRVISSCLGLETNGVRSVSSTFAHHAIIASAGGPLKFFCSFLVDLVSTRVLIGEVVEGGYFVRHGETERPSAVLSESTTREVVHAYLMESIKRLNSLRSVSIVHVSAEDE